MPINFPNSRSPNQEYTYDNKTWEWNGIYWEVYSALTGYITSAYTVGDGYSSISGVSGGNIALKSFSGNNITILDSGSKLTFSVDLLNNYLPLSGGTVSGATIFTSNLSANTLSATTYQNLPSEILKKTNVVLTSTTWVSGATWYYNYNDVDVSSGDTIIFTPATSTISVVINAIVYPEITTSGGTFTIYSQNQPSGDINGEYLIIKT